ncbi:MAG: 30S ribosomal protein S6 [Candidatus Omnitrophica bacterium]|nr:30S ribosomal protein S6 [Candidatus Omnitrophota bacterium]
MNKYETMLILKPDSPAQEREALMKSLTDLFSKNGATVISSAVWSEKRKLAYPIKKQKEGVYHLMVFESAPEAVVKIRHALSLNDSVIRASILKI